jgi:uncharacterized protein YjbI with pentapeptide repeats
MGTRLSSWRQKARKPIDVLGFVAVLVVAGALIFIVVVVSGTGFTGKTLWDWMQLLLIPVVLAVAGFWFNHRERKAAELRADNEREIEQKRAKAQQEIATDNQQEAALQAYLNDMSELLLHENLRESKSESEVRKIARVRTLTVLTRLDGMRKRAVLQFMQESSLIKKDNAIVDLSGANFKDAILFGAELIEADLRGANLLEASLMRANLMNANLMKSKLRGASLVEANLEGADIRVADIILANLTKANLERADLRKADLRGADLRETDLTKADLNEATITPEQLEQAKSFKGATMPNGSKQP